MDAVSIFMTIYAGILGLVIGSYLNVLIYRIPLEISTAKGNSYCPSCGTRLTARDLVPLFSYLFLRGKCRHCKEKISIQYPAIELLTSISFMLIYLSYGLTFKTALYLIVTSCLITLAIIDLEHQIIPDRFNVIILVCGFILALITKELSWLDRIIGAFALSLPLFLLVHFTGGMGEGDVKLFAVCGFLLGWKLILLNMLIASIAASIYALVLVSQKKATGKSEIAFGPFIALGALICMLWGDKIITRFLSFI